VITKYIDNQLLGASMRKIVTGAVVLMLSVLAFTPVSANAADECGFGSSIQYEDGEGKWVYNEDEDNYTLPDGSVVDDVSDLVDNEGSCQKTTWVDGYSDDGFGKEFSISIDSDEEGPGANSYETIEIFCTAKRLDVYIWVDYPITRGWQGYGQLKFDSGKIQSVGYRVNRTFDGLYLNSPKTFTKALLSAKSRATFKINTLEGSKVLAYPKADISSYVTKFKSLGCPLK
jgi:hypothetical protein